MENKYNVGILSILVSIKDSLNRYSYKKEFYLNLHIITTDGTTHRININNSNKDRFKINKNILIYENSAISLSNIVKITIQGSNDDSLNNMILEEIKYISTEEGNSSYSSNRNNRNNKRRINEIKNLQDYIKQNYGEIRSINCNSIMYNSNLSEIKEIKEGNVLNENTTIDTKSKNVLFSADIEVESENVISSMDNDKKRLVKDIDIQEKLVLTNNSKEVNVAKPVRTNPIEVLTSLHTNQDNIGVNPNLTKVIEDIDKIKSKPIESIDKEYLSSVLSNIDKDINIINTQTIEILDIEPIHSYINKYEIAERPLRVDPTYENYIGVVLDDGTFEPLKLSLKTLTILPNEVNNILSNIDENNISNSIIKDININGNEILSDINIKYNDKVAQYEQENIKTIDDIIDISKATINNIINKDETVSVVTKEVLDKINNINDIEYDLASNIDNIVSTNVIKSANILEEKTNVISSVELNKETIDVIQSIETDNKRVTIPFKEDISGGIEFIGNGFILINEDNNITIYATDKISSINK